MFAKTSSLFDVCIRNKELCSSDTKCNREIDYPGALSNWMLDYITIHYMHLDGALQASFAMKTLPLRWRSERKRKGKRSETVFLRATRKVNEEWAVRLRSARREHSDRTHPVQILPRRQCRVLYCQHQSRYVSLPTCCSFFNTTSVFVPLVSVPSSIRLRMPLPRFPFLR